MKHLCQGTKCHTYETQSRVRGTKGNKVLRTRNAYTEIQPNSDWANSNRWVVYFCDERCLHDWLTKHITHFMSIVGIKTTPSETPIIVEKETKQGWHSTYTNTTIKLKQNENNVLTENPI